MDFERFFLEEDGTVELPIQKDVLAGFSFAVVYYNNSEVHYRKLATFLLMQPLSVVGRVH
jgi:hypothetical protein